MKSIDDTFVETNDDLRPFVKPEFVRSLIFFSHNDTYEELENRIENFNNIEAEELICFINRLATSQQNYELL